MDTAKPVLNLNDVVSTDAYGYHSSVKVSFTNEGEAKMIKYECTGTSLVCQLPSHMFEKGTTELSRDDTLTTLSYTYSIPKAYKVYAYDKGYYVSSKIKYESEEFDIMTLKYNYTEYQFVIDTTKPNMVINASKNQDSNNELYYTVTLEEEVYLYCINGSIGDTINVFQNYNNCSALLNGTPTTNKVYTQGGEISYIDYEIRNNKGLVSTIRYTKLLVNAKKYFSHFIHYKFIAY